METRPAGLAAETMEWLDKILAEKRQVGETIQPPASEAEIAALDSLLRTRFDARLPPCWPAFWRVCDGLDFNGYVLYATRQRGDRLIMLGMPEQNFIFREGRRAGRYLLLGETGDDYFAQDLVRGDFCVIARSTDAEFDRFPESEDLLRHVLKTAFTV
jgi:hypothetical protein